MVVTAEQGFFFHKKRNNKKSCPLPKMQPIIATLCSCFIFWFIFFAAACVKIVFSVKSQMDFCMIHV